MRFKISPFYLPDIALFVVPGNGRSKPNFGRRKKIWEGRVLPGSRWDPRLEPPYSWVHCRSSLAHTLHFFLEAAGLDLTDGSSGNAGAGTAAPLGVAESHSCCCSSHSNSLNSSSSWWSVRYTPDALPKEQTEKGRETERSWKEKNRKADRQLHVPAFYQPPLSIVVPGGNESYLSSSRSRSGSCRGGSKVFEH